MAADPLRLSVIDTGWPGHMPRLLPMLDQLGYHRYWVTEHHSVSQSAAPAVLAGIAAANTSRLRIGTAGVLLNFRSPVSVASDFSVLELLHPGRIDLGVASSVAGGGKVARFLLDGRLDPTRGSYERRVEDLADLLDHGVEDEDGIQSMGPRVSTTPALWVCGTSAASAELAGRLGCCYAFHDHLKAESTDGPAVVAHYVASFRPSVRQSQPHFNVAAYGRCVESRSPADLLSAEPMSYRGSPEACEQQLRELAETYGTDEVVVQDLSVSVDQQLYAYRSLAERFQLGL